VPIKTNPQALGAPLDPEAYRGDLYDNLPTSEAVSAELARAQIELMYAIARHRQAWSAMRKHKETAEARSVWADGYTPYKVAVSDVRWWREEMTAQATTVTALRSMLMPRAKVG
jgi:hypothetical protein